MRPGGAGPVLTFDDGSALIWSPNGIDFPLAAPYLAQTEGDRVWVDFERRTIDSCSLPPCVPYETDTVEIRDGEGGKLRSIARQGTSLPALSEQLIMELFGVPTIARPTCTLRLTSGCLSFDRTQLDHLLETTPEQLIREATATRVGSPNGEYDLFWASSTQTLITGDTSCLDDGPGMAGDDGFVASLIQP
jgi:hypothetical protein